MEGGSRGARSGGGGGPRICNYPKTRYSFVDKYVIIRFQNNREVFFLLCPTVVRACENVKNLDTFIFLRV